MNNKRIIKLNTARTIITKIDFFSRREMVYLVYFTDIFCISIITVAMYLFNLKCLLL